MPIKLFTTLTHKVFKVLDDTNEKPINATKLFERFTLQAIGLAGFGFDFDAILNPDSKWVTVYAGIRAGLAHPLYFVFPWLDQKLLWLFPKRQQVFKLSDRFHGDGQPD
ncbi:unnamed protein product [Absidia cylindrospora]